MILHYTHTVFTQVGLPFTLAPDENGDSMGDLLLSKHFDFSKLLQTDVFSYSWDWYDV